MRTRELVVALVVVGAGVWLVARCGGERGSTAAPVQVPAVEAPAPQPLREIAAEPLPAPPAEREEIAALPPAEGPTPAAAPAAAPASEPPDLTARDSLEIQVLDPEGRGVFDAELSIAGVRKEGDSGSWYTMRDGPALARSDAQGLARIEYARWVDLDGRTIEV